MFPLPMDDQILHIRRKAFEREEKLGDAVSNFGQQQDLPLGIIGIGYVFFRPYPSTCPYSEELASPFRIISRRKYDQLLAPLGESLQLFKGDGVHVSNSERSRRTRSPFRLKVTTPHESP